MINEITIFFNKNPVFALVIIIALVYIMYYITQNNEPSEHMDQILPQCTINKDQHFNAQFVETNRVLNFKCNIKGVNYFLACVRMEDYVANNPDKKPDCVKSMLILIPEKEIETMLENYMKDMRIAEQICNSTSNIKCKNSKKSSTDVEIESMCSDTYEECKLPRFFLHDFNIVDVSPPNADFTTTLRKYIIKGTAIPSLNGVSQNTMFNTFLINDEGINMVCGDVYNYGVPHLPKQYAEVIISEQVVGNSGGVVGSDSGLKVKIRFNSLQQIISSKNGMTVRTPIIDIHTGEKKTRAVYLGVCNNTQTCSKGENTYPRVCVYDDIHDPNVLDFSPSIVTTVV